MDNVAVTFAKLAGIRKVLGDLLANTQLRAFDYNRVGRCFSSFNELASALRLALPALYQDLPANMYEHDASFGVDRIELESLARDLDYIFEVRANSELSPPAREKPRRIFMSHGRAEYWREVQSFVEKDLQIPTLELAQEPNRGRTVLQKLEEESNRCSYAVVVMSGDDKDDDGSIRARENVMHEIGYFQGKFGLASVCLLHEEGTSVPSNIHGLVYVPFPGGLVNATFGVLGREINAAFENR